MKLDILGGSYQQKYKNLNSQKTINWYMVPTTQQEASKSQTALFPTPGMTSFSSPGGQYVRGLYTARITGAVSRCFTVIDQQIIEIFANGGYLSRGIMSSLSLGSSKVWMRCNSNDELFIAHPSASYVLNLDTNTLTLVTSAGFPGTATSLSYLDTFFVITSGGSTWFSNSNSGLNWTGTNFFTPGFYADPVVITETYKEQIFNFGSQTIEAYYNDGSTPYSRVSGSTQIIGIVNRESLAKFEAGFIFAGRNENGEAAIYYYNGYQPPTVISPSSINWAINQGANTLDDCYSFIQITKDGHLWYYLTIPALNTTFVYDYSNQYWHERQSLVSNDSDGSVHYKEFRGRHFTVFNGLHLFGDKYSGQIMKEDYSNQTELGNVIKRVRTSQTFSQDYDWIGANNLEIDCNVGNGTSVGQGSDPKLILEISKDGGITYQDPREIPLGALGNYLFRAKILRLGSARNWVLRLSLTDPIDLMIQSAIANGEVSTL